MGERSAGKNGNLKVMKEPVSVVCCMRSDIILGFLIAECRIATGNWFHNIVEHRACMFFSRNTNGD